MQNRLIFNAPFSHNSCGDPTHCGDSTHHCCSMQCRENIEIFTPISGNKEEVMYSTASIKNTSNSSAAAITRADTRPTLEEGTAADFSPEGGSFGHSSEKRTRGNRGRGRSTAAVNITGTAAVDPDLVDHGEWKKVVSKNKRLGGQLRKTVKHFKPSPSLLPEQIRWDGKSVWYAPVAGIERTSVDAEGNIKFQAVQKSTLVFPWHPLPDCPGVILIFIMTSETVYPQPFWVCPNWVQWCIDRGVFVAMEKTNEQVKCTHRHMGTHHVSPNGIPSDAPLCHRLNGVFGNCGQKCPGIHIITGTTVTEGTIDTIPQYEKYLSEQQNDIAMIKKKNPTFTPAQLDTKLKQIVTARATNNKGIMARPTASSASFGNAFKSWIEENDPDSDAVIDLFKYLSNPTFNGLGDNDPQTAWVYCARTKDCKCKHAHRNSGQTPPIRKAILAMRLAMEEGIFPIIQIVNLLLDTYIKHADSIMDIRVELNSGGVSVSDSDVMRWRNDKWKRNTAELRQALPKDVTDEELDKMDGMSAETQNGYLMSQYPTCKLIRSEDTFTEPPTKTHKKRFTKMAFSGAFASRKADRSKGLNIEDYSVEWLAATNFAAMKARLVANPKDLDYKDVSRIISLYRVVATLSRARRYEDRGWDRISAGPEDSLMDNICYNLIFHIPGYICPKNKYARVAHLLGMDDWEANEFCIGGANCTHGVHIDSTHCDFSRLFGGSPIEYSADDTSGIIETSLPGLKEAQNAYEAAKTVLHSIVNKGKKEETEDGWVKCNKAEIKEAELEVIRTKRAMTRYLADLKAEVADAIVYYDHSGRLVYTYDADGEIMFTPATAIVAHLRKVKHQLQEQKLDDDARVLHKNSWRNVMRNIKDSSPEAVAARLAYKAKEEERKAIRKKHAEAHALKEAALAKASKEASLAKDKVWDSYGQNTDITFGLSKNAKRRLEKERKKKEREDASITVPPVDTTTVTPTMRNQKKSTPVPDVDDSFEGSFDDSFDVGMSTDALLDLEFAPALPKFIMKTFRTNNDRSNKIGRDGRAGKASSTEWLIWNVSDDDKRKWTSAQRAAGVRLNIGSGKNGDIPSGCLGISLRSKDVVSRFIEKALELGLIPKNVMFQGGFLGFCDDLVRDYYGDCETESESESESESETEDEFDSPYGTSSQHTSTNVAEDNDWLVFA